jgi:hypothetical protein
MFPGTGVDHLAAGVYGGGRQIGDQHNVMIGASCASLCCCHHERIIRPLTVGGTVENPVGGDVVDRRRIAPAVGAFANETALEYTDTVAVADGVIGNRKK